MLNLIHSKDLLYIFEHAAVKYEKYFAFCQCSIIEY